MGKLDGRVALVTGAARGQGRSHAITLAREGADVVVCDIAAPLASVDYSLGTQEELQETVLLVEKCGRRAVAATADVRHGSEMSDVVDLGLREFGHIDILLANAGILSTSPIATMSDEMWDEMLATNLKGVFNSMRAVIPHMVTNGYGRIVATASTAGKTGAPNIGHYCASKWGVIGLVKSAALELMTSGITVNAVCPTNVNTGMLINDVAFRVFRPDLDAPTFDDARSAFAMTNPMGVPWVEPEDISNAILFLVSEEARYITGETVSIAAGGSATNVA
jgi:SDR family mycofactocin-dependent oxidoreductase